MKKYKNQWIGRLIILGIILGIFRLGAFPIHALDSNTQPRYVIITTSAIAQNVGLNNFVSEKQRLGFVTEVVTEGAWGGGTGNTAADRLRSWIKANYQAKNIKYVLLIGNPDPSTGDVPMKVCCPYRRTDGGSVVQRLIPTDYYYADLSGSTWDLNGDGNIGVYPADFGPTGCDNEYDVIVGRIPCYNGDYTSTSNALSAITNYTQTGIDTSYRKTVFMPVDNYSANYGYQMGEAIRDGILLPEGYTSADYARVYDDASIGPEYSPCTSSNVVADWNIKRPGLVVYGSLGIPGRATDVLDSTLTPQLNSSYPSIVFAATPYNAYPQSSSNLAFSLLKNCSVATVAASSYVFWKPLYQPTDFAGQLSACQSVAYAFTRRMVSGKLPVGNALYNTWKDIDDRSDESWLNHLSFNVYGDPSLSLTPKYITLDGGNSHSVGLTSNGKVYAWGYNYYGQLGNGSTALKSLTPVATINLPQINAIACGMYHNLALSKTGTVWTWGSNSSGELGNGANSSLSTPVLANLSGTFTAVAAGSSFSMALKNDGTVWSWGTNSYGQLGNGTTTKSNIPVQVSNLTNVTAIAAGSYQSMALKTDGTVWVWGSNMYGQLGNGTIGGNSTTPVQVPGLSNVQKIATKGAFCLALLGDGTLRAWGNNASGMLGDGTVTNRSTPVTVSNLTNVVDIQSGYDFCLALKSGGKVYAWGNNYDGQCGQPSAGYFTTPAQLLNVDDALRIGCGYNYGFLQRSDFTTYAWGNNANGQLADFTCIGKYIPGELEKLPNTKLLSAGFSHSNCIQYDKSLWSFGWNSHGQLGDGTNISRNYPVLAQGLKNVVSVASGNTHTIALTKTGEVYAWGYNISGQLGLGDTSNRLTPVKLSLTNIVAVASGYYHSLALQNDGMLYAWGDNTNGQLGKTVGNQLTPMAVMTDVAAISASGYQTIALKKDGTVWTWGNNSYGQLGDGTKTSHTVPAKISIGGVAAIASGLYHTLALKQDGTVWAWGYNGYGELGTGDNTERLTPAPIPNLSNVQQIATGDYHSLALKKDGSILACGSGYYGQLGNSGTGNLNIPTPINAPSATKFTAITGGSLHSLALRSDDTVWAWGYNAEGALGDRSNTYKYIPVLTSLHCWGLNTTGLADLAVSSFVSPTTAITNEIVGPKVTLEIQNVGSAPATSAAGSFQVGIYLSADNKWDASDVLLSNGAYTITTPLAPGEYRTIAISSNLQLPYATGTWYLVVAVDSAGNVAEYKKYNNYWTANPIQIQ